MKGLQRKTDKFVVSARELSSRGMSFIIVMLGVILQASHTTLLMYDVSAFSQMWLKLIVSLGIGIFISSALAVFTLKYDGKNKQIYSIINVFFYFEIFTNVFYYWNSLIFSKGFENAIMQDWLYLIIAMPFSFVMPFAIKQFAGIIAADEQLKFGQIDNPEDIDESKVKSIKEAIQIIADNQKKYNDRVKKMTPEQYIKIGQNIELTVNDKKTIVQLGESSISKNTDDTEFVNENVEIDELADDHQYTTDETTIHQ